MQRDTFFRSPMRTEKELVVPTGRATVARIVISVCPRDDVVECKRTCAPALTWFLTLAALPGRGYGAAGDSGATMEVRRVNEWTERGYRLAG